MGTSPTAQTAGGMTVTLTPAGEVDLLVAAPLRAAIHHALNSPHLTEVVVDLNRVTFLDCAGIGVLIAGLNAAIRRRRSFRVTNPQRQVRKVLEIAGVLGLLTNDDSTTAQASGRPAVLPMKVGSGNSSPRAENRRVRWSVSNAQYPLRRFS